MIDRFLRNWSINLRVSSVYLAIGIGLVSLVVGAVTNLESLVALLRQPTLEGIADEIIAGFPDHISLFIPLALILFALGLLWAWFIGNGLNRQIGEIRRGVDQLRKGETGVSFSGDSRDELGSLVQSLNLLSASLETEKAEQESRRRELQNDLDLREAQLRLVGELARETASIRKLDVLLNRSINLIKSRLNYYYVAVFLVDEERRYVRLMAGTGEAGSYHLKRGQAMRLGEVSIISGVVNSGTPRLISDVNSDFLFRKDFMLPETRSEVALPLRVGREIMGVLNIHSDRQSAFSQDDISILQILADQIALAVQSVRLIQNLQRSVREANSIYQRYTQKSWSREMLGNRPQGFKYDSLQVLPMNQRLPEPVLSRLSGGHPIIVPAHELSGIADGNGSDILLAPVTMYNQLVGVVGLLQESPDDHWEEEDLTLVEAITSQVSLALDNARLLEETQLRATQIRLLQEITSVAASHTNLIELLDHVSQKMRVSFDLVHCGMFLLEPDGNALTLVASASSDPFIAGANLLGVKIYLDAHQSLESVFKERVTRVIVQDLEEAGSSTLDEYMRLRQVNTIAFIPLQSLSAVIGVASLEVKASGEHFTQEDVQLFDQISLQISSAIDVARSFEHESLRAERERKLGEVAARMRESLDIDAVMRTAVQEIRRAFEFAQVEVHIDRGKPAKETSQRDSMPSQSPPTGSLDMMSTMKVEKNHGNS
mgnify:CR=1 FL=1